MELKVGVYYENEFNDINSKIEELKSFVKARAIKLTTNYPNIYFGEDDCLSLTEYLSFLQLDEDRGVVVSTDAYIKVVMIAEEWIERNETSTVN